MSEANGRRSAIAPSDFDESHESDRLWEIVRSGLTSSFQPIYEVGEQIPFAVEGFIRGPAGEMSQDPEMLFLAAQNTHMSPALDGAAYVAVLIAFAALRWPGKLFLNVRPSTLLHSTFAISDLRLAVEAVGLHPSQIILELTEHEPIPDAAALLRALDPLIDEGITLSLDDAGAGFANMRAICELQPHFIKVDRFFMDGIARSLVKRNVVQNFVNLASEIGAKVVAEGVERDEDAQTAVQLGIDLMQGYLFGKPAEEPNLAPLPGRFWGRLAISEFLRFGPKGRMTVYPKNVLSDPSLISCGRDRWSQWPTDTAMASKDHGRFWAQGGSSFL